jgi:2-keto-3-deoxy-L-rhamnonate aldolase RhmA
VRDNPVKQALKDGKVQVGTWIHSLGAPQLPQVLATAGFDYVQIDMEHSAFSIETIGALCTAALHAGIVAVVRPPSGDAHHLVSRPIDNGAMGVLIPHVDTREQAEAAVRAVKFPPVGARGSQPPNVHSNFGATNAAEYMARSNEQSLLMVQIESEEAVANLDEILSLPGVDGATIGRGDLAAELGIGDRDAPRILDAVEATIAACQRHGKFPGLLVQNVDEAKAWIGKGVRYVTYAGETSILRRAAEAAVQEIRSAPLS